MGMEGTYLNILRPYDKPTANVILSGEKMLCYVYKHTHNGISLSYERGNPAIWDIMEGLWES